MSDKLKPMSIVPIGVEILAFSIDGKTFHPVSMSQDGHMTMRWSQEYSQYRSNFSGWVHMPETEQPESEKT